MSNDRIDADLQKSLLTAEDLGVRPIENLERAAASIPSGVEGYVIPYRNLDGKLTSFYRIRTFDYLPKYKQVKGTSNQVYFPRGVKALAKEKGYIIVTEGEKKSACATKHGFPCIGFGGVDSWRNRSLTLPEEAELGHAHGKDQLTVKLPAGTGSLQDIEESLATGFAEFIDFVVANNICVVVCYDSDKDGVKFDVQRAAAMLGFELRFRGVQLVKIKQLVLPTIGDEKIGIDDFIADPGIEGLKGSVVFGELLQACLSRRAAFPKHPNIRDFINKRLQKVKLNRKEAQQAALAVLCELDGMGSRLRSSSDDHMYYFDGRSRRLLNATLKRTHSDVLVDSEFGRFLFQEFGIGNADQRILAWLATLFTAEEPIDYVSPNKVVVTKGDATYYQINDGQYIKVCGDPKEPFKILDNGTDGILFESGKVEPIHEDQLRAALKEELELGPKDYRRLWFDVLKMVRLKRREHTSDLYALLFYMSPWLNRWRGTQLPVEMIIGEAGSGKSSLYELRLLIQLGAPLLRNVPHDMKDWFASVASTGGMHVTDNVQLMDKQLRQRLSDEMCRIVTEPNPHIEMRKYYTEADLVRIPVRSIFAITAIQQPFHNADLIQRSIIIELDKGDEAVDYAANWALERLAQHGGRTKWLAHQLAVLHKFYKLVDEKWQPNYMAKHRLVNLEQSFMLMAEVLGLKSNWVVEQLLKMTSTAVSESDWALEGLCVYAKQVKKSAEPDRRFSAADMAQWAQGMDDYQNCMQLTNPRSLGRYIVSNKQMVATIAKIKDAGTAANRQMYKVG